MKALLILISLFFSINAGAQSTFIKTYGNSQSDFGTSCVEAFDKGILLTVSTSTNFFNIQMALVKTDRNGQMLWNKIKQVGSYSYPQSVVESTDSGIVVFGSANYTPTLNGNDDFLFLLKTDSNGNDLWSKEFRFSQNDQPVKLLKAKTGGFIFSAINDYNISVYPKAGIVRLEEDGSIRWSKRIEVPFGIKPTSIVETINGNICLVGNVVGYNSIYFNDVAVCYLDSNGTELWTKVFQTYYDDECNIVTTNTAGELFISGRTYSIAREWDSFQIKLNSAGDMLYERMYDAGTSNGEIMRTGISYDDGSSLLLGDVGGWDERDITMLRLNSDGSIRWCRKYPFSPQFTNYPYGIIRTSDDGLIFTGDIRPPAYYRDAALVKTTNIGGLICYQDTVIFTMHQDTFTVIEPYFTIIDTLIVPVDSIVNVPFNLITEKSVCQQIFPIPDFTYEEDTICSSQCIRFIDKSLNDPISWSWTFTGADSAVSYVQNPEEICFESKGSFIVNLEVTNSDGTSSITKEITIGSECPEEPFVIPNVFTPNGDGKNDIFEIKNLPASATMRIYNRWGNQMFTTSEKKRSWTGFDTNGKKASDGVYFYILDVSSVTYKGSIQLIGGN